MSHALLVVMLLQGSAGAAPSVVATKPATVRPVPTSYKALVAGAAGESFRDVAKVAVVDTPALAADEVLVEGNNASTSGGGVYMHNATLAASCRLSVALSLRMAVL